MSDLKQNSIRYLQERYPHATILSEDFNIKNLQGGIIKLTKVTHLVIAQDWESGIKQKLVAVPNLGADNEIMAIARGVQSIFDKLDSSTYIARLNSEKNPKAHELDTHKLVFTPKIIIYTDAIHLPETDILAIFRNQGLLIEIVQEKGESNDLNIIRSEFDSSQRDLLAIVWQYYLKENHWIPIRLLHTTGGGKKKVRPILESFGGSVIYEQEENGALYYGLTFLGVLLSSEGERIEELLINYLRVAQALALQEPNRTHVSSKEAIAQLNLALPELKELGRALFLSPLISGGSIGPEEWNAGLRNDIEDIPDDSRPFVHKAALKNFDPKIPLPPYERMAYSLANNTKNLMSPVQIGPADTNKTLFPKTEETALERIESKIDLLRRQVLNQEPVIEGEKRRLLERIAELETFQKRTVAQGGIFISYSHKDGELVDEITARFQSDGIAYWKDDKDLFAGQVIDEAISDGIQKNLLFIIVLTPSSIASKWVKREFDEASHEEIEGRKIIIPIVGNGLSSNDLPPRMRRKLYIDMNSDFETAYAELKKSILFHLSNLQEPAVEQLPQQESLTAQRDFIINATDIINSSIGEVTARFGNPAENLPALIGEIPEVPDGGQTHTYEYEQYKFYVNYDKKEIAVGIQIIDGLLEQNYSLDSWPVLLPKFGVMVVNNPDVTAPVARKWHNYLGYAVEIYSNKVDGPVWSIKIHKLKG